MTDDLIQVVLL